MPAVAECSVEPLPEPMERPKSPQQPPTDPHQYPIPEDTTGQARVRGYKVGGVSVSVLVPQQTLTQPTCISTAETPIPTTMPSMSTHPEPAEEVTVTTKYKTLRTTEWRRKKEAAAADDKGEKSLFLQSVWPADGICRPHPVQGATLLPKFTGANPCC